MKNNAKPSTLYWIWYGTKNRTSGSGKDSHCMVLYDTVILHKRDIMYVRLCSGHGPMKPTIKPLIIPPHPTTRVTRMLPVSYTGIWLRPICILHLATLDLELEV